MEKKILFLKARTGMDDPSPPMAFSFLGKIAEDQGYKVLVENLNAQYNNQTNKDIVNLIKKEKPSIVGVHIFTNAARYSYELINAIKPHCNLLIIGGPHATACPEEVLERGADIAFIGEAEISFKKFLKALDSQKSWKKIKGIAYKTQNRVVNNGNAEIIYDLNSIPLPDKKINKKTDYVKIKNEINNFGQILSTRGCPGKCTYCFSLFEKCFRIMSAERVFEEILQLQKNYGVTFINFIDDAFTINRKRLFDLCNLFIKNKSSLKWSCGTRVDFLDKEMIDKMKEAGCKLIILGIENAIPNTLLGMNKILGINGVTTPELYSQRADEILTWCKEANVRVGTNILCGFPWETVQDMKNMQKYINRIKHDITQGFYGGILQPQPGTVMYDKYAKEYGFENWWINKKPLFKDDYRPFFMTYYHVFWDHLHNDFFHLNKKVFKEIDKLYRIMGDWNLFIFAKRRFKNSFLAFFVYKSTLLLSKFSEFVYTLSPELEKIFMERIKKFSYRFKFKKGNKSLN